MNFGQSSLPSMMRAARYTAATVAHTAVPVWSTREMSFITRRLPIIARANSTAPSSVSGVRVAGSDRSKACDSSLNARFPPRHAVEDGHLPHHQGIEQQAPEPGHDQEHAGEHRIDDQQRDAGDRPANHRRHRAEDRHDGLAGVAATLRHRREAALQQDAARYRRPWIGKAAGVAHHLAQAARHLLLPDANEHPLGPVKKTPAGGEADTRRGDDACQQPEILAGAPFETERPQRDDRVGLRPIRVPVEQQQRAGLRPERQLPARHADRGSHPAPFETASNDPGDVVGVVDAAPQRGAAVGQASLHGIAEPAPAAGGCLGCHCLSCHDSSA